MNYIKVLLLLSSILIAVFVLSFFIGRYNNGIRNLLDEKIFKIIINIRMPRIVCAIIVGLALSVSGAIYQSLFQNPMASPDILGCSNGAAAGASIAILLGFSKCSVMIFAFIFGLLTIFIVYFIGDRTRGNRVVNLILTGIMISSIFSAIISYIKLVADPTNKLPQITYWLMGSLSGFSIRELPYLVIPIIVVYIFVYMMRWQLNLLSLGDEEAMSLGVNIRSMRLIFVICATILTSLSVSFVGCIGYVGLVIPHFTRKLVGNNNLYLIPISAVLGALFLLIVDNISRNLLLTEIPIGILTAFIGAPFLLYLISRKEGYGCSM